MKSTGWMIAFLFVVFNLNAQEDILVRSSFSQGKNLSVCEEVSGKYFRVATARKQLEFVEGVHGQGIRTDGYSTWLDLPLPRTTRPALSLSAWFALETWPTDTAGFLSISSRQSTAWITAGIDRFGNPLLGFGDQDDFKYFSSDTVLDKFQWLHISLNLSAKEVQLLVNGKKILTAPYDFPAEGFDSLFIGRDARMKKIIIFPVSALNAIIDEVVVRSRIEEDGGFNEAWNKINRTSEPDLSIPRQRFAKDINRPQYHLLPAANWTNETHGLIYYKGLYHIFNQKNGSGPILRQINWGHFSSPDLLHWTEHKPVLTPAKGYDEEGIWSGHCIIGPDNRPAIMYTGAKGKEFGMCLAKPEDDSLLNWKKFSGNPVVRGVPSGYSRYDFRDPYIWKEKNNYYMIVGFGVVEDGVEKGAVLLYRSTDLVKWTYLHLLFKGDPVQDNSGIFWEMPVFWEMDGHYILLVNKVPHKGQPANALYWTGKFIDESFVPDHRLPKELEVMNRMLSPSVTKDREGRTTAIAIIPDLIPAKQAYQNGWTHVYSMPRTWSLQNGKILQQPHPSMTTLRTQQREIKSALVLPGHPLLLNKGSRQVELELELDPHDCKEFGIRIGGRSGSRESTAIVYNVQSSRWRVEHDGSLLNPAENSEGSYRLESKEKLRLHVFIDGSVIEVFINEGDAFTTRIFSSLAENNEVHLFSGGGTVRLTKATTYQLKSTGNHADF